MKLAKKRLNFDLSVFKIIEQTSKIMICVIRQESLLDAGNQTSPA